MSQDMKGRRIALIGGAGFIGHNLAMELNRRGAEVHVIDSLGVNNLVTFSSSDSGNVDRNLYRRIILQRIDMLHEAGVALHPIDAREYGTLTTAINHKIKPHTIVHLAAVAHAGKSNKNPYSTFDHSLRTLENALDCARNGIERFIFLSSSMVYGDFHAESVDEDHPLEPKGIYGALKVSGEYIVKSYQQVFDLPYTIIRPSALYGPRCVSRRVGQIFIENALRGENLQIAGDGSDRLDFTFIEDLVDGICLIVQQDAARNQTFNLTYGQSRSIEEMVSIVKEHFPDVVTEYTPRDKLNPVRGTLCVDKARRLLGYSPSRPLEVGFPKYIDWYREMA